MQWRQINYFASFCLCICLLSLVTHTNKPRTKSCLALYHLYFLLIDCFIVSYFFSVVVHINAIPSLHHNITKQKIISILAQEQQPTTIGSSTTTFVVMQRGVAYITLSLFLFAVLYHEQQLTSNAFQEKILLNALRTTLET